MANTFLTPSVVAREALMVLENNLVMANLVHRDYSDEFVQVGDTVTIRKPAKFTAKNFAGAIVRQDASEGSVAVKIDRHRDVSFEVTSKEMTLDIKDFSSQLIAPAMRAIAQAVDPQDLFRSTGQAYVRLAREEPHLFQLYLFQPRDQVASLADLYARETNPTVPAKIAADLGISSEVAQALHLHLLIYTIGIGTIFSVTSPGIPQEEIFQQQEEAYQAFLHHCLGGTQP